MILGLNDFTRLKKGDSDINIISEIEEDELYPKDVPPLLDGNKSTTDVSLYLETI